MSDKKKIVVLGGGMSSLTTAYQLSQHEEYDITVYQMGWRLGGKGASGRNLEMNGRIEEHGLHVWFGFYENAFKLIRKIYDELDRPKNSPLANADKAFTAVNQLNMKEEWKGQRLDWEIKFPEDKSKPGEGGEIGTLWSSLELIIKWMITFAEGNYDKTTDEKHEHVKHEHIHFPDWFEGILSKTEVAAGGIFKAEIWLLKHILHLFGKLTPHKQPSKEHHGILVWLMKKAIGFMWDRVKGKVETDDHTRRYWTLANLASTSFVGLLEDEVLRHGYGPLNQYDMVEWFYKHKIVDDQLANDIAYRSAPSQTVYDLFFHYVDGDTTQPKIAAGIALRSLIRILIGYKGSILWFMNAGMGDTIFTPFYQVLKQRGVKFKFFSRVTNLGLNDDKDEISTVTISNQVNLKADEYQPLVDVQDLECWPNEPLYDQIVEGAELKRDKINLERSPKYSKWKDTGGITTLEAGVDFDYVVLGITLAVLPHITEELKSASNAWDSMLSGIKTVQTQAVQVWLNEDNEGLGMPERRPVIGAFVEPYASLTDFTHLLDREDWKNKEAKHLTYTCGVMKLESGETQPNADARAKANGLELFNNHADSLWPKATSPTNPKGLNWDKVVAPDSVQGEERFDYQYIRSNIDTNEQYVQSLPKTDGFRIKTDQSDFKRLILTGTWIDLGFNIACIEAAAIAGMQAARVLTGEPKHIFGERDGILPEVD